jgi:lysyl-tRNA synthetase class I
MADLTPDQIKQMITMLQNMLPNSTEQDAEPPINHNVIKTANKKPKASGINKFDEMAEKRMHKDDIEIDKKLSKYAPTPRTRQFKQIQVTCRVCGKTETVNPVLLYDTPDRYKCNGCSGSAG